MRLSEHTIPIGSLQLRSGPILRDVRQRVTLYGDTSLPAVLITHALTGSSRAAQWWPGIIGEGKVLDPGRNCIVCINALGSCYGSTGPADADPFPRITVADVVDAQARALDALGVERLELVTGGSFGGMQALQWALAYPRRVASAAIVGAHDHFSAMGIALNALQREAIAIEPRKGIRLARKIAMLSYKSDELLRVRHGNRPDRNGRPIYDVEGYLEHQAERFEPRMDPRSYVALTHAMDAFDVRPAARHPEPVDLLFIGISSDRLFPATDVHEAAQRFADWGYRSRYAELQSEHGHDAFLAEPQALASILAEYEVATRT